jgi:hypothetical protein
VILLLVAERKLLNICCMFKAVIYLTLNLMGVYAVNVISLFFESIMQIDRVNNLHYMILGTWTNFLAKSKSAVVGHDM